MLITCLWCNGQFANGRSFKRHLDVCHTRRLLKAVAGGEAEPAGEPAWAAPPAPVSRTQAKRRVPAGAG